MNLTGGVDPHHQIKQLLQSIGVSDALTVFFDRLWDTERPYWRLFFTHKDILLTPLPLENVKFPIISWVSPNYTAKAEKPLEITSDLLTARKDISARRFAAVSSELIQPLRDLALFYLIKFVRANPQIQELVGRGDFSFRQMKETLGDLSIMNMELFEELAPLRELGEEGQFAPLQPAEVPTDDRALASSITQLSRIGMAFMLNADLIMEMPQAFKWDLMLTFHRVFSRNTLNALHATSLPYKDYSDIVLEMFNLGLLGTLDSAFWCKNSSHRPFVFGSISQIAPASHAVKCLNCGQKLVLSILYKLDPIIFNAIIFRDGLLAVALARLLDKNNARYRFGYQFNGNEIDFLCETSAGTVALETKVHRVDVGERQLSQTLKQDLIQLGEKLKLLLDRGEDIKQGYLVLNLATPEIHDIVGKVMKDQSVRKTLSRISAEVSVIGPPEVKQVLLELKLIQK